MKLPKWITGRSRAMPIFEFVALVFSGFGCVKLSDLFFKLDRLIARLSGHCEECGSKHGMWWPSRLDVLCPECLAEVRALEALMYMAVKRHGRAG